VRRRKFQVFAVAALAALVCAAAAFAAFDITRWGSHGVASGQFSNIQDVAVGPTGDVFALDQPGGGRIQRFTASGGAVGSIATSAGHYLAVGPLGAVYVSNTTSSSVSRYDPSGLLLKEWPVPSPTGIAVGVGIIYVVAGGSEIRKYTVDGALVGAWPISPGEIFPGGRDLAVDPANNVYVVQNWGAVRKFSSTGVLLGTGYTGVPGEIYGVGVSAKSGAVWVSNEDSAAMVQLSSALDKILATVIVPDLAEPRGVAVGCTDAYVANHSKDEVVRVHPAGPAGLCVTGTAPRVWVPPVVVDPTKKFGSVRASCLGPGACKGLLKIQTVSAGCRTKRLRRPCVLGSLKFNIGAGKSIAVTVKLRLPGGGPHVLDAGVTLTATFPKGRGRLLPLDRVSLPRAASGLALDCRQGTTPGVPVPFSGTLTPQLGSVPIRLAFAGPGGVLEVREAATDPSGHFASSFVPRAPGQYSALAYWTGNKTIAGARSNVCPFQVNPPLTTTTTTTTSTTGTTTTTPQPRPDLTISSLTKDTAVVANVGSAPATSFVVTVTTTAGPQSFQVPGLAPGASASLSFFCRAGAVSAVADSANQIAESNEANNAAATTVVGCIG
jgi:hypothetical protein